MRQVEEVRVDEGYDEGFEGHDRRPGSLKSALPGCASSAASRTYYKEFGAAMLAYIADA